MTSVQTENGFTRIANELLEAISTYKFNGTEFRIIMTIWRYTYGFNRKEHDLSTSFIANAIGMDNSRVRKVLKDLIDSNVVLVLGDASFNKSRVLSFNKNYKEWGVESDQRGQIVPHPPKTPQPEGSKRTQGEGSKTPQPQGSNSTPKKESIKDNIKDSTKDNRPSPIVVDNSFGEIISFYEQNVGLISPHVSQEFGFLVDDYNSELVLCALKKSVEARPQNLIRYTQGILKNWANHNVKTVEDVQKLDELAKKSNVTSIYERGEANGTDRTSAPRNDAVQSKIDAANERRKRIAGIESNRDIDVTF